MKGVEASHGSPPGLTGVPLALVAEATVKPRAPERTHGMWEAGDQSDPACPGDKRWNVLGDVKLERGLGGAWCGDDECPQRTGTGRGRVVKMVVVVVAAKP